MKIKKQAMPTRGPWHISGIHPRNIHIGAPGSPMVLASMNDCHTDTPANARLMAAAPDLAEALRAVAEFWAGGDAPAELTQQINAALAKAGVA